MKEWKNTLFREMQADLDLSLSSCLQVGSFFNPSLVSSSLIFSSVLFISLTYSSLLVSSIFVSSRQDRHMQVGPGGIEPPAIGIAPPSGGPFLSSKPYLNPLSLTFRSDPLNPIDQLTPIAQYNCPLQN